MCNLAHPLRAGSSVVTTPRRVVLADDSAPARVAVAELIALDGHQVEVASDGPTAVALILRARPDVSLIDVGLPGFDGYEVARRVRADPGGAGLRLVAFTGYDGPADRERARAAGFDELIGKPVDAAALLELIDR